MIVTEKTLKKAGLTPDKLRKLFHPNGGESARPKKIQDLLQLVESRIQTGVDWCLETCRVVHAVDRMMAAPQYQVTRSLIEEMMDVSDRSVEDGKRFLHSLGLNRLLTPEIDPATGLPAVDSDGNQVMSINLPMFENVLAPVTMAATHGRWASLFDAVDAHPLYKYTAAIPTPEEKAKVDIITSVVDQWNRAMGYRAVERQSFYQAIVHGWCLNVPQGEFFRSYSGIGEDRVLVKEGLRWAIPHRSRSFYDMAHRPSTINTDTGCAWYGHWDMNRWGEVSADQSLWIEMDENGDPSLKLSNVSTGVPALFSGTRWDAYQTLYPCAMKLPQFTGGKQQRTDKAFEYTRAEFDYGIALANTFHLLTPSQWGLGNYDEPMWFRFVTAFGDYPLGVIPMKHSPGVMYLYDADENADEITGFPLQVAPFSDQVTNLLRQYVASVRQNLLRLVVYNKDGLPVDVIRRLEALGKKNNYGDTDFIGMSARQLEAAGQRIREMFENVGFPQVDAVAILNGIGVTLSIMERVLQISPNEVGASFSHQVSATEASKMSAAASVRKGFTLGFFEDAMYRRQEILYEALMTEGDDKIFAEVSDTLGIPIKAVEKLGFKVEAGDATRRSFGVVGEKSFLSGARFTTNQVGTRRGSDAMLAQEMMKMMQVVFQSKALIELAGVETVAGWWNTVASYAGLPTDIRFRTDGAAPQMNAEAMLQQIIPVIQQMTQEQIQQLGQAISTQQLEPLRAEMAQAIEAVAKRLSRVEGAAQLPPAADAVIPA